MKEKKTLEMLAWTWKWTSGVFVKIYKLFIWKGKIYIFSF